MSGRREFLRDLIVLPAHDWAHLVRFGADVRHAVFMLDFLKKRRFRRMLWVRRVHPRRRLLSRNEGEGGVRERLFPLPGGWLYRVRRYDALKCGGVFLYEHHLPHAANRMLAVTVRNLGRWLCPDPLLFVGDPKEAWSIGHCGEGKSWFDIDDDWRTAPEFQRKRRRIADGYRHAERADLLTANTEAAARVVSMAQKVEVIRNGGAAEGDAVGRADRRTFSWPRPAAGLVGRYTDGRLDLELLRATLAAPGLRSLVAAGDFSKAPKALEILRDSGKVFERGELSHNEILRLYEDLDLLIAPHRVGPYTAAQDSIKIYEAALRGLPVLSTPVLPATDHPEVCHATTEVSGWKHRIGEILRESPSMREKRRQVFRDETWERRCERLWTLIDGLRRA